MPLLVPINGSERKNRTLLATIVNTSKAWLETQEHQKWQSVCRLKTKGNKSAT